MAVPPITTPGFFDAWIRLMCVCVLMFFFFVFFYLGFMSLSRIFHLYRADRSSKVGENRSTRGKTTWSSVRRTRLSHMWRDPSETRTTAVRNDDILVSVYIINILYAYVCAVLGPRGWQNMELSWIHWITESSEKSTEMSVVLDYSHPNGPKPCTWS